MSKAFRLKGHCNHLCMISDSQAHQVKTWWRFILIFGKGVLSSLCVVRFFLRFLCL
jgi:hypothetical protein